MIHRNLSFSAALAALTLAAPAFAADLTIFTWSGYEDPAFHPAYIEKHGGSPAYAFFADEEEAFQKLRAGFKADLAHPCSQSVPRWRDAGLLEPLDTSRITAWNELNVALRDMPGFLVDGNNYLAPFDWGSTQLTFNTEQVPPEDTVSLQIFTDPKYAGRISIGDNVDDAFSLAFLATGVRDWTAASDAQFDAAAAFLRKVHPNVRAYWTDGPELAQLMSSGEVLIAWAWNETATTMQAEGYPIAMNRGTQEGVTTWVCGLAKVANGEGDDDAFYDYVNAMLEPRVAEYLVGDWGYGHGNAAAMAAMDQAVVAEKGFADVEAFREKTLFQVPTPVALREKMIAEFEKIKAGY